MAKKKTTNANIQEYKLYGLTTVSLLLTVFITLRVLSMIQNDQTESIGFYPAVIVLLSAITIFAGRKQIDVVILNVVTVAVALTTTLFWLYGVTSAGSWL